MSPCHPIWYPLAPWNGRHMKHTRSCSAHQQTLLVPLQHRMMYHSPEMVPLQRGHKTWEQSRTQNFRCHNSQPLLRGKGSFWRRRSGGVDSHPEQHPFFLVLSGTHLLRGLKQVLRNTQELGMISNPGTNIRCSSWFPKDSLHQHFGN